VWAGDRHLLGGLRSASQRLRHTPAKHHRFHLVAERQLLEHEGPRTSEPEIYVLVCARRHARIFVWLQRAAILFQRSLCRQSRSTTRQSDRALPRQRHRLQRVCQMVYGGSWRHPTVHREHPKSDALELGRNDRNLLSCRSRPGTQNGCCLRSGDLPNADGLAGDQWSHLDHYHAGALHDQDYRQRAVPRHREYPEPGHTRLELGRTRRTAQAVSMFTLPMLPNTRAAGGVGSYLWGTPSATHDVGIA
jgi:hypothetical protein